MVSSLGGEARRGRRKRSRRVKAAQEGGRRERTSQLLLASTFPKSILWLAPSPTPLVLTRRAQLRNAPPKGALETLKEEYSLTLGSRAGPGRGGAGARRASRRLSKQSVVKRRWLRRCERAQGPRGMRAGRRPATQKKKSRVDTEERVVGREQESRRAKQSNARRPAVMGAVRGFLHSYGPSPGPARFQSSNTLLDWAGLRTKAKSKIASLGPNTTHLITCDATDSHADHTPFLSSSSGVFQVHKC